MLVWTREQERAAFYLFGETTGMPCPDCGAVWATAMSGALVKSVIHHKRGCEYAKSVRKSLTRKKGT